MEYLRGIFGILVLLSIAFVFSKNRRAIDWRLVGIGLLLQIIFGFLVIKVPLVTQIFSTISEGFVIFLNFSKDGASFLFGGLARSYPADDPSAPHSLGVIFAFQVLPTIIFFSTVSAGLYYLGILQKLVYGIAWIMARTMRLSGAESLSAAGNIFMGQTEAPLLVRPFVPRMTNSELMCLMVGGMATIAGSVLGAYVAFLGGTDPEQQTVFAASLLSASIMNAPAGIVMAKMLMPEMYPERIDTELKVNKESLGVNLIDALAQGAVIALINYLLTNWIGSWTGLNDWVVASTNGSFQGFSLEFILGRIFQLLAFVMGVEWKDTLEVGSLLGQKTVINEFVAYLGLAGMKNEGLISPRSIIIATYALCGFSNFSSIAIQIGGIGSMAPNQQANLSRLGLLALLGATLACMMTATVAGALVGE
jgi:concentrative nucleoside transporter, CNT family